MLIHFFYLILIILSIYFKYCMQYISYIALTNHLLKFNYINMHYFYLQSKGKFFIAETCYSSEQVTNKLSFWDFIIDFNTLLEKLFFVNLYPVSVAVTVLIIKSCLTLILNLYNHTTLDIEGIKIWLNFIHLFPRPCYDFIHFFSFTQNIFFKELILILYIKKHIELMFLTENISFDYYYNKDLIIDDSCKFFLLFYDILTDYYLFLNFYPFYYFIFTLDWFYNSLRNPVI